MSLGREQDDRENDSDQTAHDVSRLLSEWGDGNQAARDELFAVLYPELKRIARLRMRSERGDHTLQPSALVSEFFVRMASSGASFNGRSHFLAVASMAMRRILVDYAKSHRSARHGGGVIRLNIDDLPLRAEEGPDVVVIDELLVILARKWPRCAQVVELRCFGGLTNVEIAEALGRDERTVKRDWRFARVWLMAQLEGPSDVLA